MIYRVGFFLFVILLSGWNLLAATLPVGDGLVLEVDLPAGWVASAAPPDFLVAEMAENLEHEAIANGQSPTGQQLREAATQRLAANEAYIYREPTGARLVVDFSPLRPGEAPAAADDVAASARFAAEGMKAEEGVSDVRAETAPVEVAGAGAAHRLEVDYRYYDRPMKFLGIVGFAEPYWFYLYYTDALADRADLAAARGMLNTLRLRREQ